MLGYVTIAAVESLSGDGLAVGEEQQLDRPGNVGGMHLLASAPALDRLARHDGLDERVPLAGMRGVSKAIDARRAERAERHPFAMAVALNESLDRRLVSTVMAMRPERMGLVQRPVRKDPVVHGTGRDEDKPFDARGMSGVDQAKATHEVYLEEFQPVPGFVSESAAGVIERGVDDGVGRVDELLRRPGVAQRPSIQVTEPFGMDEGKCPRSLVGRCQQINRCPAAARLETT